MLNALQYGYWILLNMPVYCVNKKPVTAVTPSTFFSHFHLLTVFKVPFTVNCFVLTKSKTNYLIQNSETQDKCYCVISSIHCHSENLFWISGTDVRFNKNGHSYREIIILNVKEFFVMEYTVQYVYCLCGYVVICTCRF